VVRQVEKLPDFPTPRPITSNICDSCDELNILSISGFSKTFKASDLESNHTTCDLCRLLWKAYQENNGYISPIVRFETNGSVLIMNGIDPPVLSICRSLGESNLIT
jgi:hypothetical protein